MVKKGNQKLGFLRRNLRGCSQKCKTIAYISLVRAGMEYAATIWDPFLMNEINSL